MNTPADYRARAQAATLRLRQKFEESLAKSIKLTENGIRKHYDKKGWHCMYCPEKKLNQSGDAHRHIESKRHQENLLLGKLAI